MFLIVALEIKLRLGEFKSTRNDLKHNKNMSNQVDIEYCGSWGYGGPATRLKDYISKNYGENLNIKTHSATGVTGTIKVSWIKGGSLDTVWEKGKAETEGAHAEILGLLKQKAWFKTIGTDYLLMRRTSKT